MPPPSTPAIHAAIQELNHTIATLASLTEDPLVSTALQSATAAAQTHLHDDLEAATPTGTGVAE